MSKKKLKRKIELLRDDIANKWIVSIVLAGLSAVFTGAYAVLSPHVFVDFKQPDILFILSSLLIAFVVGCVLIFYGKTWKIRMALLIVPFISIGGFILYYEKILIHNLNSIEGPKLIILYPEKFNNLKLKNEWDRSINEIPATIVNKNSQIKLLKIPTRFTENIDDSLLLREINNRYDIVGYIIMHEVENAVMLELKLPASEDIKKTGVSWIESEYSDSGIEKNIEINAGYSSLSYRYFQEIKKTGPHIGTYSGVFSIGFDVLPKTAGLNKIRRLRNLPVADVLEVPINNLTRGVYFSVNMISIAYLNLAGYPDGYCSSLERYAEFDSSNPEFDFLKKLDPLIVVNCLSDKGDWIISRITKNLNKKYKNEIYMKIIRIILSSSKIDDQYMNSGIFKKGLIDKVIKIRDYCGLKNVGYEYYKAASCVLYVVDGRSKIKVDEPILKTVLSNKIYELLGTEFWKSVINMNYREIQNNMIAYDKVNSLIGGANDYCEMGYLFLFYSILTVSDLDEINKSEENMLNYLNEVSGVFSEVSKKTQCKNIEIPGVDFSDLVFNKESRKIFSRELRELLGLRENARVKDFLSQFLKLIYPYLDNESDLSEYIKVKNEYNTYKDAKLVLDYFKDLYSGFLNSRNIGDGVWNDVIDDASMFIESRGINYDSVLNYPLDEESVKKINSYFDRDEIYKIARSYLIRFYKNNKKNKDPLISEAVRFMYDIRSGEIVDDSASLKPMVFKNPIHMMKLYFYLKKVTRNREKLNEAMNVMSEMYPGEADGLIYKHFEMLKEHLGGDYNMARGRANDLIPYVDPDMKSFYRFYISSIQYNSDNIKCRGEPDSEFRWPEYVVNKYRPVVINHLLMDKFNLSVWEKKEDSDDNGSIDETDVLAYDKRFKHRLLSYIEAYYANNEAGNNEKDGKVPDSAFLSAISDSRQQCGL